MGQYTDHIKNASHRYLCILSLLLNSILVHGVIPDAFKVSTVIPIPKNKRKSLNSSDNYRAVALSSVVCKLLEKIIMSKFNDVFYSSKYQYGYKEKHSTTHCSFVVNEIINYYAQNNSCTYVALLDASKAFDRLHYGTLFRKLIDKKLCPIVTRFLLEMYKSQLMRVKWCNSLSRTCEVSNGVKQGGVLSPLLFTVYLDELLERLKSTGFGCHIGTT
ncbi:MAG: reverse transcriptase family protein, partial [Kangiellaceae bacterium]|nr:reverse transcriptase family protein [Kangiellaceae bacterium]